METLFDIGRALVAAASLLLAGLCLRVVFIRARHPRTPQAAVSPPLLWSYAIFAAAAGADQMSRLHEPVSWRLPVFMVAVLLGVYAVGRRVHVPGVSRLFATAAPSGSTTPVSRNRRRVNTKVDDEHETHSSQGANPDI